MLDRRGALRPVLEALPERAAVATIADEIEEVYGRCASWLVLAQHVAPRGEILRVWDALGHVQRHLPWGLACSPTRTEHWLTPSRRAEHKLPSDVPAELFAEVDAALSITT